MKERNGAVSDPIGMTGMPVGVALKQRVISEQISPRFQRDAVRRINRLNECGPRNRLEPPRLRMIGARTSYEPARNQFRLIGGVAGRAEYTVTHPDCAHLWTEFR